MSTATMPTRPTIGRPQADEHSPYYGRYIDRVPDGDLPSQLRTQIGGTLDLLASVPANRADYAYAPGKWTVKEVVGHLADVERVMSYRALTFARRDETPLPGFDENAWAPAGNFGARTMADLAEEFRTVRAATVQLISHLEPAAFLRRGSASNNTVSVRALFYIIAGHELHHAELLRERYLK
ncbi:MAG: DinB family protein [Gemmatimonadales bacterium]